MSTDPSLEPPAQAAADPDRQPAFAPRAGADAGEERAGRDPARRRPPGEPRRRSRRCWSRWASAWSRAESGEQALRALLREDIAVILLDVRMAGLDGLQTARIIRARPAHAPHPDHLPDRPGQRGGGDRAGLRLGRGRLRDQAVRARDPARQGRRCSSSSAASAASACASRAPAPRPRRWRAPCARCRSCPTRRSSHLEIDGLTAELVERAGDAVPGRLRLPAAARRERAGPGRARRPRRAAGARATAG